MNPKPAWDASALRVSKDRESLREKTIDRLREAILNQYFTPGDRLIERELCELTGVSRTSVREALRQLESEGLIETIPNRGPIVASVSVVDAQHIYEVREVLEGLAARLFVERASDDEIEALIRHQERLVSAIRKRDVRGSTKALDAFYRTLFEGSDNPVAASLIRTLFARMHYLRATTTHSENDKDAKTAVKNYQRIVAAVKKRDAKAAVDACARQVRHSATVARLILSRLKED